MALDGPKTFFSKLVQHTARFSTRHELFLRWGHLTSVRFRIPYLVSICEMKGKAMQFIQKRQLWGWLNTIFNRVDPSRIKDVGPDRACAEWLLRCGANVRWQNSKVFVNDYNSLPAEGKSIKIVEIDATDSAVMNVGFPHFRGLTAVEKLVLHRCSYLDDDALKYLPLLKASLKFLQISSCGNITVSGLQPIKELSNLQNLLLYDLPEISNREEVISDLQKALPKCEIDFPYAQASEQKSSEASDKKMKTN